MGATTSSRCSGPLCCHTRLTRSPPCTPWVLATSHRTPSRLFWPWRGSLQRQGTLCRYLTHTIHHHDHHHHHNHHHHDHDCSDHGGDHTRDREHCAGISHTQFIIMIMIIMIIIIMIIIIIIIIMIMIVLTIQGITPETGKSTKRRNSASESTPVKFHCVSKPVQNHESMMSTQLKYHHRNKLAPKNSNTNHRFRF